MRSINDKGLDLHLRLPFWIGGPGPLVRAKPARRVQRGTLSLNLTVTRGGGRRALAAPAGGPRRSGLGSVRAGQSDRRA
ncbi:MAG: hypothetical protein LW703_09115 [Rhodobacter sp.]|nr:hypothetical protein [Rhodobacter sp.]